MAHRPMPVCQSCNRGPECHGQVLAKTLCGLGIKIVMLSGVRSYRWLWKLVSPITVVVCSVFVANAMANVISEQAFPEERMAAAVRSQPAKSTAPTKARSKDSSPVITRNMFCSTCIGGADELALLALGGTRTMLPLRLIATNISTLETESFASVVNTENQRQGAYRVGEEIPDAGIVHVIGHDYVDFQVEGSGELQRVNFDSANVATKKANQRAAASSSPNALASEYVRSISDTHFEVDRDLISKLQSSPHLAGARAMPVHKDGAMTGVRLSAVRNKGLAYSLGLRSGDTVLAANGVKLSSLEAGLELMGQLSTRDHWNIEIERKGKPIQLQVDLQ